MAPIEEDMLLGLDFLEANGVSLHLKEKELQIAGEVIPMSLGTGSPLVSEKETGVFLVKGCKVPPNSVMRVGAQLSESMAGEYIVKAATKGEMFISLSILTCINFLQMFSGRLQHLPEFKFKFSASTTHRLPPLKYKPLFQL